MQDTRETRVQSRGQEDPLEEDMTTHEPIFSPGDSHGRRSLVGYSPGGVSNSETRVGDSADTQAHTLSHTHKLEEDRRSPPAGMGLPPGLRE